MVKDSVSIKTKMSSSNVENIFLIGLEIEQLSRMQLPTNRQGLSFYKHQQRISPKNYSTRQIATAILDQVNNRWSELDVPTRSKLSSLLKFDSLYNEWKLLQKAQYHVNSVTQNTKENKFSAKLNDVFDVKRHDVNISPEKLQELTNSSRKNGNYILELIH